MLHCPSMRWYMAPYPWIVVSPQIAVWIAMCCLGCHMTAYREGVVFRVIPRIRGAACRTRTDDLLLTTGPSPHDPNDTETPCHENLSEIVVGPDS